MPQEVGGAGGERRLAPPRSLLTWLIQHPEIIRPQLGGLLRRATPAGALPSAAWERRRQFLKQPDKRLEAEALEGLATTGKLQRGAWFVFEGPTSVDCFLETERLIVTIEGKRTERRPTTTTDWLPTRHQLLRNLDAAFELANGRRVVAFFIVEGDGRDQVPDAWRTWTDETISEHALTESLPHRSPDERALLADGYLGATTWQLVCDELNLPRALLLERVIDP